MEKTIKVKSQREVLSLATDITYSCVPDWYSAVVKDLKMDLIIPKHREEHEKLPAILWFCGGAFSVVSKGAWMPEMVYFARRGYVVASAEYRTSNKATFPAAIIDAKAAVRYLKAHADALCIDPEKIFVMGESAGGALACMTGAAVNVPEWEQGDNLEFDSTVKGVIDFYGVCNLQANQTKVTEEVPGWVTEAYLGPDPDGEAARRSSAVHYITKETVPFLIFHGAQDQTVPIAQSQELYEKLRECGVPSDFYTLDGADHGEDIFYQDEVKGIALAFMDELCEK